MATLNTSAEGPAITRSYQNIVNAPLPSGPAAASPTYGQWVVLHAAAPLGSAFQPDAGKESTLKVQTTGEGELVDLIDEFNDGRIQYAFAKVKDPNSSLPKSVLIAWCGEGVPERTKGYFTTHTAAVAKLLHGYHVQITARNDRDLTPESIVRKVADASGSNYSGDRTSKLASSGPPPPVASKPVFQPSKFGGASAGFKPLGTSRTRQATTNDVAEDNDGWGIDAPQVTRSQLQKVESAYKPTKVDIAALTSQKQEPSRFVSQTQNISSAQPDVIRGGYQPIGKVDIAAIRKQAQQSGQVSDDRPTAVKGSYEPVGKVDIAAIRAKAQAAPPSSVSPARTGLSTDSAGDAPEQPKSLAERSAAFSQSERITSMPKPKVAPKFGGASAFSGTTAPAPGGFAPKTSATAAPIGAASRSFADQGGKTPAQLWAERKAREGGSAVQSQTTPIASQTSGNTTGGEWQSGYTGKKWASVQTNKTGGSALSAERTGEQEPDGEPEESTGGFGSVRDRFKEATPISVAPVPPPMDFSSKPNARSPDTSQQEERHEAPALDRRVMPPPPAQPPRDDEDDEEDESQLRPSSPIRIAQPVARTEHKEIEPARMDDPPMPTASLARNVPPPETLEEEPQVEDNDLARGVSQSIAGSSNVQQAGKQARAEYDYEKAEDNEIDFVEGDIITNIDMVDTDWWMGTNSKGDSGLFPAVYVSLLEDEAHDASSAAVPPPPPPQAAAEPVAASSKGPTATAEYDYEAAEENEISFPEGAVITNIDFPDEDWWSGTYNGKEGLFPANYVKLNE